ncbi:oligosaccharide flippase family protein [Thermodesulfovibrio sp. 3907-1M]|uniref:Oligosaccharide flippase family protein n=1 Tax=Thermodesulfovibrio autotrophicus TaxID=3118333 RepID=A0AAU8GU90_9BACT
MFKDISSVTLAFVYVNILGYVFHSAVSQSLGPAVYGEFMVLYSFMLTVGNITVLLGTVSIKTIIENYQSRFNFLSSLRLTGLMIGAVFALTVCALSSYLREFLHVTEYYYFFIVALAWLGMSLVAVERSFLQATGKFPLFAFSTAIELTVRLIAALVAIYAGLKVGGVLFSTAIGAFAVLIILLIINGNFKAKRAQLNIKKMLTVALYASPIGFFVYADNIFIKRILDEHAAGIYSAVSIVGKVLVWFILTILSVYFPKFVEAKDSASFRKLVFHLLAIVVLSEVMAQIACLLIGKPLFLLLFGAKFESALKFLPLYLLALLPLLFNIVFISMAVALERYFCMIYAHLFLFYAGFLIFPLRSISDYLAYIFCINAFFVLLYFLSFKKELKCISL